MKVALSPSSLEKVRTSPPRMFSMCFEASLKKKIVALVVAFCVQAPVLYYLYTAQVPTWKVKSRAVTSRTAVLDVTSLIRNNENISAVTPCTNTSCKSAISGATETISSTDTISKTTDLKLIKLENNTSTKSVQSISFASANISTSDYNTSIFSDLLQLATNLLDTTALNEKKDATTTSKADSSFPTCPEQSPQLQGAIDVSFANQPATLAQMKEDYPLVSTGGSYKPPYCIARWKVAIIIPFRDREEHLRYFLQYMHPTLQRQQLDYRIYIINQFGTGKFNRAKLMNIGYAESIKDDNFGCFVFHDVDLILENDHSIYSCPELPRHLSVGVDKFKYNLPYSTIFGGVTELTREQFEKVNGYSNNFWGWGGEDDDMYNRVAGNGMSIIRYPANIARYRMISHRREKGNEENPKRFELIRKTHLTMRSDGLNSLQYKVVTREDNPLYTNVTVDVLGSA